MERIKQTIFVDLQKAILNKKIKEIPELREQTDKFKLEANKVKELSDLLLRLKKVDAKES